MLKRAIFGILGPAETPWRRRGRRAAETLPKVRWASSPFKGRRSTALHRRGNSGAELVEDSGLPVEIDTNETESLSDESDESAGESNPAEDPKVRKALIRRAAALYAEDSRRFLQVMRKHETGGEETDSEDDPELLDPESDHSVTEEFPVQGTTERRMEKKEENEEVDEDGEFKRGKFHCKLCPKKVFIFEADLEKHLESRVHKRRQTRWETLQQRNLRCGGCEVKEPKTETARVTSVNNLDKRQLERKRRSKAKVKSRRSERRKNVESLSAEEIQARKEKFQRKKQRRLERRASATSS